MIEDNQKNIQRSVEDGSSSIKRRRYFSSTEGPFQSANNIYLFYGGADRTLIVDGIADRIRTSHQPVIVSGETGSGKTMMSLVLAQRLQHNYKIIHFDHRHCDFDRLLRLLLIELTPDLTHVGTRDTLVADSNAHSSHSDSELNSDGENGINSLLVSRLLSRLQSGRVENTPALVIVDSAMIDPQARHLIELVTSVLGAHGHPLSAVLFLEDTDKSLSVTDEPTSDMYASTHAYGQPSAPHYSLNRMNLAETTEYLNHHMLLFDFNKRDLFTREMAYFIADKSGGNCSMINTLARNAFLLAHLEGSEHITMGHLLVAGAPERKERPIRFLKKHKRAVSLFGLFTISSLVLTGACAFLLGALG